jgi:GDP-L-fucose synthase
MTILVTGGTGLLGVSFKKIVPNSLFPTRKEFDLSNPEQIKQYFEKIGKKNIDTVIHLAAFVGGVKANTENVFNFYQQNSNMNNNVIDACVWAGIPKLVCCLSTCIYPDRPYVSYPLTEEQLHLGPPHPSNFGYAYAKRMVDVQLRAARKQHGLEYISVIPNNLYGENDNFDLENSHVIPALIRKIWEAKINDKPHFEVWGDGEVYREFSYAGDIAKAILFCLENYKKEDPINIGNTQEYFLKDIISLIKKELDYNGNVVYNKTKPKGQTRKPTSNEKFINLGWKQEDYIGIEDGIRKTCEWFKRKYPNIRGVS